MEINKASSARQVTSRRNCYFNIRVFEVVKVVKIKT